LIAGAFAPLAFVILDRARDPRDVAGRRRLWAARLRVQPLSTPPVTPGPLPRLRSGRAVAWQLAFLIGWLAPPPSSDGIRAVPCFHPRVRVAPTSAGGGA
jgi:hypothetical protein